MSRREPSVLSSDPDAEAADEAASAAKADERAAADGGAAEPAATAAKPADATAAEPADATAAKSDEQAAEPDDAPAAERDDRAAKPDAPAAEPDATTSKPDDQAEAAVPAPSQSGDTLPMAGATAAEASPPRRAAARQGPVFYVAGFWRRLLGAAIDLAAIVPVSLLLGWIAGAVVGLHLPPSRHRGLDFWLDLFLAKDPALLGGIGLLLAIAVVYLFLFQLTMARTPGMRLLKLRIIDAYGDPPSMGRVLARTAGYLVALGTLGLGFLWIGFDSEKRGLQDWIAGTYVVKD